MHPTRSDTSYFVRKSNGKLKPVAASKAEFYMVEFYKKNLLTERKRVSLYTGNILQREFYKNGRPYGTWLYFNSEAELISQRDFSKLVYGACEPDTVADHDFTLPEFGLNENDLKYYLRLNIKYPSISRSKGTSGIVTVNFIVDETGKANLSHICGDGLDGYCDLVVWEIIEQMPRWKPGEKDGKPVEVSYFLPVQFKLK